MTESLPGEALLHYVWKHKLYVADSFRTTDKMPLEIIDTGIYNSDAGPDFFNAKIKLGDKMWAGNIEIHTHSSDWYKHNHDSNKAYNSVILHVVTSADKSIVQSESGRNISQWVMKIPSSIQENYLSLVNKKESISCLGRISEIPSIYLTDWRNALLTERLERKTNQILQLLENYKEDWNEVFYIVLARNFGFGINNDAFERLAKSLPLKYIFKHCDSEIQTEALLLGQAGLLENDNIPDGYYLLLQEEYRFLSQKYSLLSLEPHIFKSLRIRPNNFPHIKIVQLAGYIGRKQTLFSQILETEGLENFQSLFYADVNDYWERHYHFEKKSAVRKKRLGLFAINILLINTVVPVLFAYGQKTNQETFMERAIQLLEIIPSEKNHIVHAFEKSGMEILHAGDTQALIQLKREYCEPKKCIYCRIGHKLLYK